MEPSHIDRFYNNLSDLALFIEDLIRRANQKGFNGLSPELITIGTAVMQTYNKEDIVKRFINGSISLWDQILNESEEFMHEHSMSIFSSLDQNNVASFKLLFTGSENNERYVDEIDKSTIWCFMKAFVRISIKYIHDWQEPYFNEGKCRYRKKYPLNHHVSLHEHAKKWDVKLSFHSK